MGALANGLGCLELRILRAAEGLAVWADAPHYHQDKPGGSLFGFGSRASSLQAIGDKELVVPGLMEPGPAVGPHPRKVKINLLTRAAERQDNEATGGREGKRGPLGPGVGSRVIRTIPVRVPALRSER